MATDVNIIRVTKFGWIWRHIESWHSEGFFPCPSWTALIFYQYGFFTCSVSTNLASHLLESYECKKCKSITPNLKVHEGKKPFECHNCDLKLNQI